MPRAVRGSRESFTQQFGLSGRQAARIGVLLKHRIGLSEALLEELPQSETLSAFLLCSELRSPQADFSSQIENLLADERFHALQDEMPLVVTKSEPEGWLVLAFEEEVDGEEGFDAAAEESANAPVRRQIESDCQSSVVRREDQNLANVAPLSDEECASFRLKVFAGADSRERVSALRYLAYGDWPAERKQELFLQALGEEDGPLRVAAANALRTLGLSGEAADLIRIWVEGDSDERRYACERATSNEYSEVDAQALCMALLGLLRHEEDEAVCQAAFPILGRFAAQLPVMCSRWEDLWRFLIEQSVGALKSFGPAVRQAFLAFDPVAAGELTGFLLRESSRTQALELKSFLLGTVCRLTLPDELKKEAIVAAADCLFELPSETATAHGLGAFLCRQDEAGLRAILQRVRQADVGHQRAMLHLLDPALRYQDHRSDLRLEVARVALDLCKRGSRQLNYDLFETRLLDGAAADPELAAEAAQTLLSAVRDFALPHVQDHVQRTLERLGVGARGVLVETVANRTEFVEGRIACRALGEAVLQGEPTGEPAFYEETLRLLQRLSFDASELREDLYLTMGKICAGGGVGEETAAVIRKSLTARLSGESSDGAVMRALGWMLCAPGCPREERSGIIENCFQRLEAEPAETGLEQGWEDGEEVYSFTGDFDAHSEMIPACLDALERILTHASIGEEELSDGCTRLVALWSDCAAFRRHWSPGNLMKLTHLLGHLGRQESLSEPLRRRLIKALSQRLSDLPVLEALAGILAAGVGRGELDRLAGGLVQRLLKTLDPRRELTSEDRELYSRVLGKVLQRGRLALSRGSVESLWRRAVDELARGMRDRIPGAQQDLMRLREMNDLPKEIRQVVEDVTGALYLPSAEA